MAMKEVIQDLFGNNRPPPPGIIRIPKIPGPRTLGPFPLGKTTENVPFSDLEEKLNEQRRALGAPPAKFSPHS